MGKSTNIKEKAQINISGTTKQPIDLVLFNDDIHTFDYVIKALIRICDHTPEQAEQSAYIVHNNGKCVVKHGEKAKIQPMCDALVERGLKAKIQS